MTIPVLPSSDNCFFPQPNDFLDKAIPTTPVDPSLLVEIGGDELQPSSLWAMLNNSFGN